MEVRHKVGLRVLRGVELRRELRWRRWEVELDESDLVGEGMTMDGFEDDGSGAEEDGEVVLGEMVS